MKQAIGTCVYNPFGTVRELERVIDAGRKVSRRRFLMNCDVDEATRAQIKQFPDDYEFFRSGAIWFFTWSAIEHFYR